MKQLTPEQLKQYVANPLGMDEQVRMWCNLPENKYYTVSVWPEERAGQVRSYVQKDKNGNTIHRVVKAKKISKSDQQ